MPGQFSKVGGGLAGAALALLLIGLAGDRSASVHAGAHGSIDLPPLMLWAWDHDDDLRIIDPRDTGVAFLAATVTLTDETAVLTPRHNPLALPEGIARVAVVHVESDRTSPPTLSAAELDRFVAAVATVADEVPHRALQVDYEAPASQRAFLIAAIAALRQRLPREALSVTALASWCATEQWTDALAADEVVPMLFRMGYDGRRLRANLAGGGDFRSASCHSSVGIAMDELPGALPSGRRIYVFNPKRWSEDAYRILRERTRQWVSD